MYNAMTVKRNDLLSQNEVSIINKIRSYEGDLLEDFTVGGELVDWRVLERVMFFSVMYLMRKVQEGDAIQLVYVIRNWWVSYGISTIRPNVDDFAYMASTWLKVPASFVLEILRLFDAVA